MKLANWNLERAATAVKRKALEAVIAEVTADVWVFTETREELKPALPYSCRSTEWRDMIPGKDTAADHWVSIWSRHSIEKLDTRDTVRTVAARIHPEEEPPFLVFGTVLPWLGDRWHNEPSFGGVAFQAALKVQQWDWEGLRKRFPKDEFFVMGDFNQDMVETPPHYYGSEANKVALLAALDSVGLVAVTAGVGDPIRRDSAPCACIDHICMLKESRWKAEPAMRWPDAPLPDKRLLSDHFGVSVELSDVGKEKKEF